MASGNGLFSLAPQDGIPTASTGPSFDTRNLNPLLNYAQSEGATFGQYLPPHYGGNGITVLIDWVALSATSGNVVWGVSIERGNTDIDSDSFGTETLSSATAAPGTNGVPATSTVTVSSGNMDGAQAGEWIRVKITRKAGGDGDTMTGDAQLRSVLVKET